MTLLTSPPLLGIAEGTRAHVRNTISFVEFETMVSIDGNTDDLKEIYAMFDEDGDGYISAIELEHAMQILVTKGVVTHAEVDHMVTAKAKGGIVAIGICHKVRKTPSWSRSWVNFSLLWLCSHRNSRANWQLLGQPNTFLAAARGAAARRVGAEIRADNSGGPGGPTGPLVTPFQTPTPSPDPLKRTETPSWDPLTLASGTFG